MHDSLKRLGSLPYLDGDSVVRVLQENLSKGLTEYDIYLLGLLERSVYVDLVLHSFLLRFVEGGRLHPRVCLVISQDGVYSYKKSNSICDGYIVRADSTLSSQSLSTVKGFVRKGQFELLGKLFSVEEIEDVFVTHYLTLSDWKYVRSVYLYLTLDRMLRNLKESEYSLFLDMGYLFDLEYVVGRIENKHLRGDLLYRIRRLSYEYSTYEFVSRYVKLHKSSKDFLESISSILEVMASTEWNPLLKEMTYDLIYKEYKK